MSEELSRDAVIALVEAAKSGDMEAFAEILSHYQGWIYNMTYQIVRNSDDAMDLTQEVFIKAWKSLPGLNPRQGFSSWLRRVAVNSSIDLLRRRKRWNETGLDDPGMEAVAALTVPQAPAPEQLSHAELGARIQSAIDQLTPDHRTVILLKEVEGMTYEEIAQAMESSIGTVMSRLFYARKKLQALLKDVRNET